MYILLKSFFPNFIKVSEEINNSEGSNLENSRILEDDFIDIGSLLKNEDVHSQILGEEAMLPIPSEEAKQLKNEDAQIPGEEANQLKNEDAAMQLKNEKAQIPCEEEIQDNAQVTILLARYSRMQLIDICRQYGLPRTGGKVQLAERIAIYKNKD